MVFWGQEHLCCTYDDHGHPVIDYTVEDLNFPASSASWRINRKVETAAVCNVYLRRYFSSELGLQMHVNFLMLRPGGAVDCLSNQDEGCGLIYAKPNWAIM